jgi:hypothetical protein
MEIFTAKSLKYVPEGHISPKKICNFKYFLEKEKRIIDLKRVKKIHFPEKEKPFPKDETDVKIKHPLNFVLLPTPDPPV